MDNQNWTPEQENQQVPPTQEHPQPQYTQPQYTQPQYTPAQYAPPQDTLGKWLLTLFIAGIPIVGFIMLFVWGFGNSAPGIKNYARAALIWQAVVVVLMLVIVPLVLVPALNMYYYW